MTSLQQDAGAGPPDGEAPLLPVMALARGLAMLRGDRAHSDADVVDAAYLTVDLQERGWTVVATPERKLDAARAAAVATCLAIRARAKEVTPRLASDAEALLIHLQSRAFGLVECEATRR